MFVPVRQFLTLLHDKTWFAIQFKRIPAGNIFDCRAKILNPGHDSKSFQEDRRIFVRINDPLAAFLCTKVLSIVSQLLQDLWLFPHDNFLA